MSDDIISALDRAKHEVVHDFRHGDRRGAVALGPLVNISPGVLSNKVNYFLDTHHLTVDEAVMIQDRAGDFRIIEAEAMLLGGVFVPLPDVRCISDIELLTHYSEWQSFIGRTCAAIHEALDDGDISREELDEIRRRGFSHIGRFFRLLHRLEVLSHG